MTITSSVGIFSGIDTASLIDQLLQLEARPRFQFQARIQNLQVQQGAYLDINSRLRGLQDASAAFRVNSLFDKNTATSSDEDAITASAGFGTPSGSYLFQVDRLVSTRNLLSRGFADRDQSAFGASSFTFEGEDARLTTDTELSALNGGDGIKRGSIRLTVDGQSETIDLSRVATVDEVLSAINESGLDVTASVRDGAFVLEAGSGTVSVAEVGSGTTASTLGLLSGSNGTATLTGNSVYFLDTDTTLATLNDGNGVFINNTGGNAAYDFTITVGGDEVRINLGDVFEDVTDPDSGETTNELVTARAGTIGAAIDRINAQLDEAGYSDISVALSGDRLAITDTTGGRTVDIAERPNSSSTTAADLGLLGSFTGSLSGERLLAGMNSRLTANLNGGMGLSGTLDITDRTGASFSLDLTGAETLDDLIDAVATGTAGSIALSVNDAGTGFTLTDTTGGLGNLIVAGDTADELRLATDPAGVAQASVRGSSAQLAYVTAATSVGRLNNGQGIGTGTFRITDTTGVSTTVNISESIKTVGELLTQINGQLAAQEGAQKVFARINDNGDGILIEERVDPGEEGTQAIIIEDTSGVVAQNLRIAGTAAGVGADNFIDGSYETTISFDPDDTLDDVIEKLNEADAGVVVSLLNDGSATNPFRLSITSTQSGSSGRFTLDTGGFDLGLDAISEGEDARVFFGSSDPAKAVLLTSTSNSLDGAISGLSIDLKQAGGDPVTITVNDDTDGVEEGIESFISAFNAVITRIDQQTRFDEETETRGPLLGDSSMISLRSQLFTLVTGTGQGLDGRFQRLLDVGVSIGDGGKLEFDSAKFREAYAQDPDSVAELFEARALVEQSFTEEIAPGVTVTRTPGRDEFSSLGIAGRLEELAKNYINSVDGVLTRRTQTIDSQIELQRDRITALDERLDARRLILERQFLVMEQSIASLQSQQASLGQIAGLSIG